jgi:hypothetical protein
VRRAVKKVAEAQSGMHKVEYLKKDEDKKEPRDISGHHDEMTAKGWKPTPKDRYGVHIYSKDYPSGERHFIRKDWKTRKFHLQHAPGMGARTTHHDSLKDAFEHSEKSAKKK